MSVNGIWQDIQAIFSGSPRAAMALQPWPLDYLRPIAERQPAPKALSSSGLT